uniref:Carboxypeptidase n=1 Tax=Erpetoichthys calabaricus TaxID=27687 RepID=A0A8C4S397_ERPCA
DNTRTLWPNHRHGGSVTSLLISAVCLTGSWCQYAPDQITSLPGLTETLSFRQWSGYLEASPGTYLYYWFVESQNNPATDPLVLWLNGGPGCSSLEGLLAENGPFLLNDEVTLSMNEYSWNKVANMLYLESPAGVGFSYSTSQNYQINDPQVAEDNYQALLNFFAKFPSFTSNDFYIFAESYGGIYAPTLSEKIVSGSTTFNFKGMGIGNGMASYNLNDDSLMYFGYYHGLFGDNMWAQLNQYCCSEGSCNFYNNSDGNCIYVSQATYLIEDIGLNIYSLYSECWGGVAYQSRYLADVSNLFRQYNFDIPAPVSTSLVLRSGRQTSVPACLNGTAMYTWLNDPEVREALHIPVTVQTWELCSPTVRKLYQRTYHDMTPFYKYLLGANVRILVYNGDTDMACNFIGSKWFVEALNQQVDYQPWYYQNQIAGYYEQYNGITFLTVKVSLANCLKMLVFNIYHIQFDF